MCVHLCDGAVETYSNSSGIGSGNPLILKLLFFEHLPRTSLSGLPSAIFTGTLPSRHSDLRFIHEETEAQIGPDPCLKPHN